MRVIIAGSRTVKDYNELLYAITHSGFEITTVISGTAEGADRLGEQWAKDNGVPLERYPADWNKYGFSAGYFRNVKMAETAEALILVWTGQSKGSASMKRIALMKQMLFYEHVVRQDWF
jgi:hypothetical protein